MSTSALEEKKAVAMHDTKARNLQAKINALHNIEKASYSNKSLFSLLKLCRMSEDVLSNFKR
jgi:hypothetical protein